MTEEATASNQYVIFAVYDQLCAFTIDEVLEIIQINTITEVPGIKKYIAGVINLRGNVIPIIDLRRRYDMPTASLTKKSRILVIRDNSEKIGLIVDEVLMVTYVSKDNIEPPQEMFDYIDQDCYKGFAKIQADQLIGIFNIEKILYPEVSGKGV